ncbi:MAG: hypothetical protein AB7G93_02345 [Bdellovibrionales bacterium]
MLSTQSWLPLMEYSAKYRVSLSTLRRRIKAGEIEHKFSDGKYLLKDGPLQMNSSGSETIAPPTSVSSHTQSPVPKPDPAPESDPHWKTVQALLSEIKKAYALILQEKEEQILQLKEEVADLKTLVRVLEDDNTRLKKSHSPLAEFDLGLET